MHVTKKNIIELLKSNNLITDADLKRTKVELSLMAIDAGLMEKDCFKSELGPKPRKKKEAAPKPPPKQRGRPRKPESEIKAKKEDKIVGITKRLKYLVKNATEEELDRICENLKESKHIAK
jgi:hypothetical protein